MAHVRTPRSRWIDAGLDALALLQAQRVAHIYETRRQEGWTHVAVVGDFNDTPASAPLDPLLTTPTSRNVSAHPNYIQDGRTGTFQTSKDKLDHLLLSPELFAVVTSAGLNRSGVWHGPNVKNPWPMLKQLTKERDAASDHAAIFADLAL
jgi:hypothetical protein